MLDISQFKVYNDTYYKNSTFYIKNDVYIPLKKDEKRKLISHIVLDKIDNYKTNDRVGVDKIYLNNNLLYQEDIYIIKEKNKTKNIFTKIKEWYSD